MRKTILLVDDDKDILDAMCMFLDDAGYEVRSSSKGETAEQLVRSDEALPNLLILDMLLSGKDGRTIATQLKQNERTKNLPILMVSAHPNAKDSVFASGADAFLAKPFDVDSLLTTITTYIS